MREDVNTSLSYFIRCTTQWHLPTCRPWFSPVLGIRPRLLRNSGNIRNITCKSQLLSISFLPSTINTWNALPAEVRSAPSLPAFKRNLIKPNKTIPQFYYDRDRKSRVQHAGLRMHCSSLDKHLFSKYIVDSSYSQCGEIEDTDHFFFRCPLYRDSRSSLFDESHTSRPITLQLLLSAP